MDVRGDGIDKVEHQVGDTYLETSIPCSSFFV